MCSSLFHWGGSRSQHPGAELGCGRSSAPLELVPGGVPSLPGTERAREPKPEGSGEIWAALSSTSLGSADGHLATPRCGG